jgi:hypothetical protein
MTSKSPKNAHGGYSDVSVTQEVGPPSNTSQNRVLQSVRARCHTQRIDCQQHEAETYHLVIDHLDMHS